MKLPIILKVHVPDSSAILDVPVNDPVRGTPEQLLSFLQKQGALPPSDPDRPFQIHGNGMLLSSRVSFADQNITDGATIEFRREGFAA